jgi:hypothetical protein
LFRHSATLFPLASFLFFLTGCGEPVGKVSGMVTYKGEPVTTGSISFNMKGKGIAQDAKLDSKGKFTMSAPMPVGTYHVCYIPPTPEPQDPRKGPTPVIATVVPDKYHDLQTSDLSFVMKTGMNEIPIALKD